MNNKFYILLLKASCFVILFFLLLNSISFLFTESKISVWDKFYEIEKDSLDILILGNSHANAAIDNNILDAKLRIKTVSLATRGQNIYQTYYAALEAYNHQIPEILIIENFLFYERLTLKSFINQDPSTNDYKKRYLTFEGKKLGKVKIEEAKTYFKGSLIENLFPVIKKHTKWKELETMSNLLYKRELKFRQKGTTVLSKSAEKKYSKKSNFNLNKYNLLPEEEKMLKDIINLAQQKGTKKVILLTVPFYKGYRNKIDYASLADPLKKIKNDYGDFVEYIDLNAVYGDWDRTYFSNDPVGYNQHLNYKGQIITSNYIAKKIINTKAVKNGKTHTIEDYYYNDLFRKENMLLGNLEKINKSPSSKVEIKQGEKKFARLSGWMTIKNEQSSFDKEMRVILIKNDKFIYFNSPSETSNKIRKDVTKYFNKKESLYDYSGFSVDINTELLLIGDYEIHLLIRNKEGEFFSKNTKKRIIIY